MNRMVKWTIAGSQLIAGNHHVIRIISAETPVDNHAPLLLFPSDVVVRFNYKSPDEKQFH